MVSLKISIGTHFATLMKTFPDNEVDHEPGKSQTSHQLPLDEAKTLLQTIVCHQDAVAEKIIGNM